MQRKKPSGAFSISPAFISKVLGRNFFLSTDQPVPDRVQGDNPEEENY
jgi:hypothetical protein